MTKEFKIVAVVIIIMGGLFFVRERKLFNDEKESYLKYEAEKTAIQKTADDAFSSYESIFPQKEQNINKCLSQIKKIKWHLFKDDQDLFMSLLVAMKNKRADSIERADTSNHSILGKLNQQNAIIIYFDELDKPELDIVNEINLLRGESSSSYCKLNKVTDLDISKKAELYARIAGIKYIVVQQLAKVKYAKLLNSKEFDPGYLILNYEVFNIENCKMIKSGSTYATNSESLYTMSSAGSDQSLQYDLESQGKKEITKIIYGITNL